MITISMYFVHHVTPFTRAPPVSASMHVNKQYSDTVICMALLASVPLMRCILPGCAHCADPATLYLCARGAHRPQHPRQGRRCHLCRLQNGCNRTRGRGFRGVGCVAVVRFAVHPSQKLQVCACARRHIRSTLSAPCMLFVQPRVLFFKIPWTT